MGHRRPNARRVTRGSHPPHNRIPQKRFRRAGASTPTVSAVTFDVGGTLIEPWPSVGHIYAEVAGRHGWPNLSIEALNRGFATAWRALRNFNYTKPEWRSLVDATFHGQIDGTLSRAFFSELYEHFAEGDAWRIFDDVVPTLQRLKNRGVKLGVISNWDRRLGPLLRTLKLDEFFDVVVVSCHAGACKPSRRIFEQAVRRLRVPAKRVLHVGDSPELDRDAARAAGMQALLLGRDSHGGRRRVITSLRELL
jgi:putative hydrolase of the HAD superfamily